MSVVVLARIASSVDSQDSKVTTQVEASRKIFTRRMRPNTPKHSETSLRFVSAGKPRMKRRYESLDFGSYETKWLYTL